MKNIFVVMALTIAPLALASEPCSKEFHQGIVKLNSGATVEECVMGVSVLPSREGGVQQVIALTNGGQGITITVYAVLEGTDKKLFLAPKPLYQFSGLGVRVMPFSDNGNNKTRLMIRDMNADGYAEIGVLVYVGPNSIFNLKSYDVNKKKFQDVEYQFAGSKEAGLPIVVAVDELLTVPQDFSKEFVVKGTKESRSFLFSKRVD